MAKTEKAADSGGKKGPSALTFIAAMGLLTLVAAGAGGFYGMQLIESQAGSTPKLAQQDHAAGTEKTGEHGSEKQEPAGAAALVALAPIITNLAAPEKTWIRLDAALLFKGAVPEEAALIAGRISADIVAYLRTVTLKQIEGPGGFLSLREDLNERVRIRSKDMVGEIVIKAFIVE